jgi:uncharacterized protein (DUF2141 family)
MNTLHPNRHLLGLVLAALIPASALASDLIVKVSGVIDRGGQIGCALFSDPKGFPMDGAKARQLWVPVEGAEATCTFAGLPVGYYAISVSQDLNGNKVLDTNFLGIPREPWGVSNNPRPTLRAPRWDEAVFQLADSPPRTIEVRVSR